MKPRVLWVEDSARLELRNLTGPIYFSGKYDFSLAEDITTAIHMLRVEVFDAIIVDIRLPPGIDPKWNAFYRNAGADKVQAQLGMRLLYWLLGSDRTYPAPPPDWITPRHIAVFTVESRQEIQKDLDNLRIATFEQKVAGLPDTILLRLIEQLLTQSNPRAN